MSRHIDFFTKLKSRSFGVDCCIWIVTTNYDVLFETAAAYAQVNIVNGFCGATNRYFDQSIFEQMVGSKSGNRFVGTRQLTVKLIKLHGSLSWFTNSGSLFEMHPDAISPNETRTLILPRRKKVMETLAFPFDQLFSRARRILTNECRYIVSCGFSYGDDHITDNLILPSLRSGRCRLMMLAKEEPAGIAKFKNLQTFNAQFANSEIKAGQAAAGGSEIWRFSEFVKLFS